MHGGLTPAKSHALSIYSNALPTNLQNELSRIKQSPLFSSMIEEFAILKVALHSMLKGISDDIADIYGKPVCEVCGANLAESDDSKVVLPIGYKQQQARLDNVLKIIKTMTGVFDSILKHTEKQKKYVLLSELENMLVQWGKIIKKYLDDDPRLDEIQNELMRVPFGKMPDESDEEILSVVQSLRTKAIHKKANAKRDFGHTITEDEALEYAMKKVAPEVFEEVDEEVSAIDLLKRRKNK